MTNNTAITDNDNTYKKLHTEDHLGFIPLCCVSGRGFVWPLPLLLESALQQHMTPITNALSYLACTCFYARPYFRGREQPRGARVIYEVLTGVLLFFPSGSTGHSKVSSVKNMLDVKGRPQEGPSCAVAHGSLEGLLFFFFLVCIFLGHYLGKLRGCVSGKISCNSKNSSAKLHLQFFSLPGFISYSFLFFLRRTLMEKNIDI